MYLPDEATEKNQGIKDSSVDRSHPRPRLGIVGLLCAENVLLFLPLSFANGPSQNTFYCFVFVFFLPRRERARQGVLLLALRLRRSESVGKLTSSLSHGFPISK